MNTSDPDGDTVTVTDVSVDKTDCLEATHNNTDISLTPQGAVSGHPNPSLDTANTCNAQITVTVDDNHNHTATCTKTIAITYPRPRLYSLIIMDRNDDASTTAPHGPDDTPLRNTTSDNQ